MENNTNYELLDYLIEVEARDYRLFNPEKYDSLPDYEELKHKVLIWTEAPWRAWELGFTYEAFMRAVNAHIANTIALVKERLAAQKDEED